MNSLSSYILLVVVTILTACGADTAGHGLHGPPAPTGPTGHTFASTAAPMRNFRDQHTLRVATFDIKSSADADAAGFPWSSRRAATVAVIEAIDADVLAVENASNEQLHDLIGDLTGLYPPKNVGITTPFQNDAVPGPAVDHRVLLFVTPRLQVSTFGVYPLPGPSGDALVAERPLLWATIDRVNQDGSTTQISVFAALGDGLASQVSAAGQYVAMTAGDNKVLVGDFGTSVYTSGNLLTENSQLTDAFHEGDKTFGGDSYCGWSYPCQDEGGQDNRQDWVFSTPAMTVEASGMYFARIGSTNASNHWPIWVDLSL